MFFWNHVFRLKNMIFRKVVFYLHGSIIFEGPGLFTRIPARRKTSCKTKRCLFHKQMKKCEKRTSIMYRVGRVQIDVCSFESIEKERKLGVKQLAFLRSGVDFWSPKRRGKMRIFGKWKTWEKHGRASVGGTLAGPGVGKKRIIIIMGSALLTKLRSIIMKPCTIKPC